MTRPLTTHAVPADVVPSDVLPSDAVPAGWRRPFESGEFDRRPALLTREAVALEALSPLQLRRNRARGIPRRTAGHWSALARLVAPLDAARAAVHHGDDVRYRRAVSASSSLRAATSASRDSA